jgi:hypothetical protein
MYHPDMPSGGVIIVAGTAPATGRSISWMMAGTTRFMSRNTVNGMVIAIGTGTMTVPAGMIEAMVASTIMTEGMVEINFASF